MSKRLLILLNILAVLALILAYLSTYVSPEKAVFLAVFGIAYGVILVTNLVFIVFWLFVKKRLALISTFAILIGFSHLAAYVQLLPHLANSQPKGQSIKVLSQNVKLFGYYNWKHAKQDRDTMIMSLKKANADIYCFQEYFHHNNPGLFETFETLKAQLDRPYSAVHYSKYSKSDERYGIVTYSKYPIVNSGVILFKYDSSNSCIFSDININGDTIRVYNAHVASIRFNKDSYQFIDDLKKKDQKLKPIVSGGLNILDQLNHAYKRRAEQVNTIKLHADESPYPVIICGDFNDTPVSYSYARLSENMVDSFRESGWGIGNTYIGKFPSFRIDYIFHSPSLHSLNYEKLPETISDHHAISTEINWQ